MTTPTRKLVKLAHLELVRDLFLRRTLAENRAAGIYALGSSVVAGTGVANVNDSWFYVLHRYLRQQPGLQDYKNPQTKTLVQKRDGFGGYSSRTLVEEEKYKYIDGASTSAFGGHSPDVAILESGMLNDHGSVGTWGVPIAEFKNNVTIMVNYWKTNHPNTRIFLCSTNQRVDFMNMSGKYQADYNVALQEVAATLNVEFIDVLTAYNAYLTKWAIPLSQTLSDATHPNELGYMIWADVKVKLFTGKDYGLT